MVFNDGHEEERVLGDYIRAPGKTRRRTDWILEKLGLDPAEVREIIIDPMTVCEVSVLLMAYNRSLQTNVLDSSPYPGCCRHVVVCCHCCTVPEPHHPFALQSTTGCSPATALLPWRRSCFPTCVRPCIPKPCTIICIKYYAPSLVYASHESRPCT